MCSVFYLAESDIFRSGSVLKFKNHPLSILNEKYSLSQRKHHITYKCMDFDKVASCNKRAVSEG